MKEWDVTTWDRRVPYECFSAYDRPIFSFTSRLDVTDLVRYTKRTGTHYFTNMLYIVSRVLNDLQPFRLRFFEGRVVEHERIDPSFVVMDDSRVIVTCRTAYTPDYAAFCVQNREDVAAAEQGGGRAFNATPQNDVFFVSSLPWIDFQSMSNPYHFSDPDNTSIPRITWGKFVPKGDGYDMAMDISVHHGLMDGYHVAEAFSRIEQALLDVEAYFKQT